VKLGDFVWELIDNALFIAHITTIVVVVAFCGAVSAMLWFLLDEVRGIRAEMPASCECRHIDQGPGPILPRVLPRVRRIGEEPQ